MSLPLFTLNLCSVQSPSHARVSQPGAGDEEHQRPYDEHVNPHSRIRFMFMPLPVSDESGGRLRKQLREVIHTAISSPIISAPRRPSRDTQVGSSLRRAPNDVTNRKARARRNPEPRKSARFGRHPSRKRAFQDLVMKALSGNEGQRPLPRRIHVARAIRTCPTARCCTMSCTITDSAVDSSKSLTVFDRVR